MSHTWSNLQAEHPFLVLDGAMGTELEKAGVPVAGHPLWTALAILHWPQAVREVHLGYAQAGADILTTATYQASLSGLLDWGLSAAEAAQCLELGVALAAQAIEIHMSAGGSHRPMIAASMGPYGAFLANRSEYSGEYGIGSDGLYEFHAPRMDILASSEADILACETVPSLAEGEILVSLLAEIPEKPAWLSFSCRNGYQTNHGEDIQECVDLCADHDHIWVGVNCVQPQFVSLLLQSSRSARQGIRVVYPNQEIAGLNSGDSGGSSLSGSELAGAWVDADVHVLGGCCGTTPAFIRSLAQLKEDLSA